MVRSNTQSPSRDVDRKKKRMNPRIGREVTGLMMRESSAGRRGVALSGASDHKAYITGTCRLLVFERYFENLRGELLD